MCNLREEGDSSDDACASVFVHKDDDIPNSQHVRVDLIEVSDYYFSQEENLNLPTEVWSAAYFRQVGKAGGCKKATGRCKKVDGRGKKVSSGGKKPTDRGKKVEPIM